MILVHEGKLPENAPRWNGQCHRCGAVVECAESEATLCSDKNDGWTGQLIIKCPTPHCGISIVLQEGKWKGQWMEPKWEQKDWYMTPIVPADLEAKENNG